MRILQVTHQQSIVTLAARGWSVRKISRELGVHRKTVAKYLRCPLAKGTKVPAGSATSRSQCERWRPQILEALSQGLSAQRIFQDLVREFEFTGSYDAVKRFVRFVGRTTELPFRRMENAPGEEMQVDFGQGAWVVDTEGRK